MLLCLISTGASASRRGAYLEEWSSTTWFLPRRGCLQRSQPAKATIQLTYSYLSRKDVTHSFVHMSHVRWSILHHLLSNPLKCITSEQRQRNPRIDHHMTWNHYHDPDNKKRPEKEEFLHEPALIFHKIRWQGEFEGDCFAFIIVPAFFKSSVPYPLTSSEHPNWYSG